MAYEGLNFEEVGPRFVKAKEYNKGDVLVTGKFAGTIPGWNNDETKPSYVFEEPNGSTVTIYHFANLENQMAGVKEGMICRVTHNGTYMGGPKKTTECQSVRVQTAGYAEKPQAPKEPEAPTVDEEFSTDEGDL